jgi:hypothetical protein
LPAPKNPERISIFVISIAS